MIGRGGKRDRGTCDFAVSHRQGASQDPQPKVAGMGNTPVPTTISGFTVLPVEYSLSGAIHYLYVRKHAGSGKTSKTSKDAKNDKETRLPDGRTLFVVNMPPDATEREVVHFFKFCGTVERVLFMGTSELLEGGESDSEDEEASDEEQEGRGADGKDRRRNKRRKSKEEAEIPKVVPLPTQNIRRLRKTGKTAHVVFLDASSLDRFLSVSSSTPSKLRPWTLSEEPVGLSHYIAQYVALRPPLDAVKEHADSYIRVYDYEQEKMKQKSKYRKGEAIVDEDGFTLVVRGGAYGRTLGGGVAVASKQFQQTGVANEKSARKRRKAGEDKGGFYAFQKAEKQRNGVFHLFVLALSFLMTSSRNSFN